MARDLDVVLYGATGFVGKLTADYLRRAAPEGTRIALAGRSRRKLEQVCEQVGGAGWDLIVADAQDSGALRELAARSTAVATTVGPYRKYGKALVTACAETGTHYADLTGEHLFMREVIDELDGPARASGARIVHNCGFDSIPSDIGTLLLHEAAGELTDTTLVVRRVKGGFSGGTIDSLRGTIDEVKRDRSALKILGDPYGLSPDRAREPGGDAGGDLRGVRREFGAWVGPFIMAQLNTRVVRRSNALLDWAYGREFRYREVMAGGSGPVGFARASGIAGLVNLMPVGMALPPTRFVLDRVLPDPGEGPDEDLIENGFFHFEIHTRTPSGEGWRCDVRAQGDPGYGATAVMLGESVLALALDGAQLPDRAGVLTPATGIGSHLATRLRAAGHSYDVTRA